MTFDDADLVAFHEAQGGAWGWQTRAAEHFQVSPQNINKRWKRIEKEGGRAMVLSPAGRALVEKRELTLEDLHRQLTDMNAQVWVVLDLVSVVLTGERTSREYWDANGKLRRLAGPKQDLGSFAVKYQSEARKQLELVFNVAKEVASMKKAEVFMDTVLAAIREADPETADTIMAKLNEIDTTYSLRDRASGHGGV